MLWAQAACSFFKNFLGISGLGSSPSGLLFFSECSWVGFWLCVTVCGHQTAKLSFRRPIFGESAPCILLPRAQNLVIGIGPCGSKPQKFSEIFTDKPCSCKIRVRDIDRYGMAWMIQNLLPGKYLRVTTESMTFISPWTQQGRDGVVQACDVVADCQKVTQGI